MLKSIFYVFIFIFLITGSSAINFSIYPPKAELKTQVEEKICREITISASSPSKLSAKIRWNEKGKSNSILEYNKTSKEMNIEVFFQEKISINRKTNTEVCFIAHKKGEYYGAVLYKIKDAPLQTGSWVELNVTEKNKLKIQNNKTQNKSTKILYTMPILLFIVLMIFVVRLKSTKNKTKTTEKDNH